MAEFPETRVSLILRLAESADVQAWQEFSEVYAPAIYALARHKGLQAADAEDLTQEVLFGVARAVERFQPDRSQARFRTWLGRIARNLLADFLAGRGRRRQLQIGSDSWFERCADESQPEPCSELDDELRTTMYQVAAKRVSARVSESTWAAFQLTAVEDCSGEEAARKLGIAIGTVYVARSRVLRMLRDAVRELRDDFTEAEVESDDDSQNLPMHRRGQ